LLSRSTRCNLKPAKDKSIERIDDIIAVSTAIAAPAAPPNSPFLV
jgi:hypothetical protein